MTVNVIIPQIIQCVGRRFQSTRHSNLGKITTYLVTEGVPKLLQRPLSNDYLDEHIKLRLLPSTHPYLPVLHGKSKYRASMNAVRLLATKFVLQDKARLKVDNVITMMKDQKTKYNCITPNDKLVIKWQSCNEQEGEDGGNCEENSATEKVHNVREVEPSSLVIDHILNPTKNKLTSEVSHTRQFPRLVRGIFIFEFNQDNSSILVHTIDSVEMVDFDKKIQAGALASV